MEAEEKSSDEILKELFGICMQALAENSEASSQNLNSDSSDGEEEEDSRSRKHKHKRKKKKKHKKMKKRKSASDDDEESDSKSYKQRLKRIKKEVDEDVVPKVELQIKSEKEDPAISSSFLVPGERFRNKENKSNNYVNSVTGKLITMDDVFNSLGITDGLTLSKIKQEEVDIEEMVIKREDEFVLLRPEQIKKEKPDGNDGANRVKEEKPSVDGQTADVKSKIEGSLVPPASESSTVPSGSAKMSVTDVFTDEADKQASSSKKISIKNLKNSVVYEATMKEIEERERQRAEKYEEGELSTDSNSSEEHSEKDENSVANASKSGDERKKRRSSHEKKKKHKLHSSKKKHRHEGSRIEHRSSRKYERLDHDHRSRSGSVKSHHHHSHRSRSAESESQQTSKRSHKSTRSSRQHRSSRERSRSRSRSRTQPSRSKSHHDSAEKIDKRKLLEIARKNAINLLQQGAIPASMIAKTVSIKAGGKTVDELTDFCKQLSKREAEGDDSDHLSSGSENGDAKLAFHHPFQLKERPSSIIMNIRNAIPLPVKTAQEKTLELSKQLSLQYPVSSGQHHQSEWVPVEKSSITVSTQITTSYSTALVDPTKPVTYPLPQIIPSYHQPPAQYQPPPLPKADSVFPTPQKIDVSNIVAQRLEAIRRLNENPRDPIGANLIRKADSKMNLWAESGVQPGFFTGSTGVKLLSAAELSGGYHAWPKKVWFTLRTGGACYALRLLPRLCENDQFIAAKPVASDKGEALMKKMGWQPGEGLGKYKQGPATPCEISLKTDRKGLAEQPMPKGFKQSNTLQMAIDIAQNKHPVSLLNEFCSRRKLPSPQYDCEEKEGTGKRKLFLFSVTVQGLRYTPKMPSTNKKQSKMEAATVCLQSIGLLPTVAPTVAE